MRALIVLLSVLICSAAFADRDYVGLGPQWSWEQPGSTPEAWNVYVSRNGGDFELEQTVTERPVTITGDPDETLQLKVSAVVGEMETELSDASELVTLKMVPTPMGVAIYCEGELVEITPGWWTCQ